MKSSEYLLVGLGNPGSKYQQTRHNIGFRLLDYLQIEENFPQFSLNKKFQSELSEAEIDFKGDLSQVQNVSQRIYLAKPQTYMNNSGEAVRLISNFYKLPVAALIVAYDEIDLPFGKIRVNQGNSSGGHNGIKSIEQQISSKNFIKLRIGVGRPEGDKVNMPVDRWVLSQFSAQEEHDLAEVFSRAKAALDCILREGVKIAQNKFN